MTRIFAAVTMSTVLLAGGGALAVAYDGSGADSAQLDGIMDLFGSGLEISALLPIALLVGLVIASLGVMSRA